LVLTEHESRRAGKLRDEDLNGYASSRFKRVNMTTPATTRIQRKGGDTFLRIRTNKAPRQQAPIQATKQRGRIATGNTKEGGKDGALAGGTPLLKTTKKEKEERKRETGGGLTGNGEDVFKIPEANRSKGRKYGPIEGRRTG